MNRRTFLFTLGLVALLSGCDAVTEFIPHGGGGDGASEGAVYTLTNAADGNEVVAYRRAADGSIHYEGRFATGGKGSGDGLNGTTNPLILSPDHHFLFAVNGGSNQVSAFRVHGAKLVLVDVTGSGGRRPISATVHGSLLYVLNAGQNGHPGNIAGFTIGKDGTLTPIGTRRPLPDGAVNPSQIGFSPDGQTLVVTDKPTNTITTYQLGSNGRPGPPNVQESAGMTPFGFDFTDRGMLLVSEAFGGQADSSATSSYSLMPDGTISVIDASVPTMETAACWIRVNMNSRYAYTTNTASGTITGYRVSAEGELSLLEADGISADVGDGSTLLDLDITEDDFLYVHAGGFGQIVAYKVMPGGALEMIEGRGTGLPPNAVGVQAF